MRLKRRDFLRIGGAGALTALGCNQAQPPSTQGTPQPAPRPATPAGTLLIDFTGLVLLEKQAGAAVVHLVDGKALSLGPHVPQMRVPAAAIDQAATTKPDASHVISLGGTEFWLWDLDRVNVTAPAAPNGGADLSFNESSFGTAEKPPDDEGWKSLFWVPDLRSLCGATKIMNRGALTSAISLSHGRLESAKPNGIGPFAVWKFTDPKGEVLMRRALTNRLVYACPTEGQALRLNVGSQAIVFQPGADALVTIKNLPPEKSPPPACPSPCTPNITHFVAFFGLVDAQFTPTASLDSFTPPTGFDAEPEYCPPGSI